MSLVRRLSFFDAVVVEFLVLKQRFLLRSTLSSVTSMVFGIPVFSDESLLVALLPRLQVFIEACFGPWNFL